jgi:hypothetical protein
MYAGAASDPKTRQLVEGADLVLDLGGVNWALNDSAMGLSIQSPLALADPSNAYRGSRRIR